MGTCCSVVASRGNLPTFKPIESIRSTRREIFQAQIPVSKYKEAPSASIKQKKKSSSEVRKILGALDQHFVLRQLDKPTKELLIDQMRQYTLGADQIIFEEGRPGYAFFILSKGLLAVCVGEKKTNTITPGTGFGEYALINDNPRTATIITEQTSVLWGIDRQTFKRAVKLIGEKNHTENLEYINSNESLKLLAQDAQHKLLEAMVEQYWAPGGVIIKEGERGDCFYFIKEGKVRCDYNQGVSREMLKGDYFGELAVIHEMPRSATVTAIEHTKLLSISKAKLEKVFGDSLYKLVLKNSMRIALERSSFKELTENQIEKVVETFDPISYRAGEIVIRRGEPLSQAVYIILKGNIRLKERVYSALECIGDRVIESNNVYYYDGLAMNDLILSIIKKKHLETAIGGRYADVVDINHKVNLMRSNAILNMLSTHKLYTLAQSMKKKYFPSKSLVFTVDEPVTCCFYVIEGGIEITNDSTAKLVRGFLDEDLIFTNEFHAFNAVALGDVICWVLEKDELLQQYSPTARTYITDFIHRQNVIISVEKLLVEGVILDENHKKIYKTSYEGVSFLLTVYIKNFIVTQEAIDRISFEDSVLHTANHFMIIKPLFTIKHSIGVLFISEYVEPLYLSDRVLEESETVFLAACMVSIIEHLHSVSVIHRKICPQSFVVDKFGYLKLVDLSLSKVDKGRTYTIISDPHYSAPEMIMGTGYTNSVDWWALGVTIYHMVYRTVPIGEKETDPISIYNCILSYTDLFEKEETAESPVKNIIQQLMSKDPCLRLPGGVAQLKKHNWFEGINWDKLEAMEEEGISVNPIDNTDHDACLLGCLDFIPYDTDEDIYRNWKIGYNIKK